MTSPRTILLFVLLIFVARLAAAFVSPHLINSVVSDASSGERVPTFSKLLSGLGILSDSEVEELTLTQIEGIEALKSELSGALGVNTQDEPGSDMPVDMVLDLQTANQFNNIGTGSFVMEREGSDTDLTSDFLEPDFLQKASESVLSN